MARECRGRRLWRTRGGRLTATGSLDEYTWRGFDCFWVLVGHIMKLCCREDNNGGGGGRYNEVVEDGSEDIGCGGELQRAISGQIPPTAPASSDRFDQEQNLQKAIKVLVGRRRLPC